MGFQEILSKRPPATCVLWVDEAELCLQLEAESAAKDSLAAAPLSEPWNPSGVSLHSAEARSLLASAMERLVRRAGRYRFAVRLVLGDALCVTRVTTGEGRVVQQELRDIELRSQLYLSLGLGDKLTGQLQIADGVDQVYAVTAIVNRLTLQTIFDAARDASLNVESIEPASLSLTRAIGTLGLDAHMPVLRISFDKRRCDVAITRGGRLMLSYRVSGWKNVGEAGEVVCSHLARLKRFCERYRLVDRAELKSVLLLGADEDVAALRARLLQQDRELEIHDDACELFGASSGIGGGATVDRDGPSAMVRLALLGTLRQRSPRSEADEDGLLPAPDLLQQIEALQPKSMFSRLNRGLWPTYAAAGLMFVVAAVQWYQSSRMSHIRDDLDSLSSDVAAVDAEVQTWEQKAEWVRKIEAVDRTVRRVDWQRLIAGCAECLPPSVRLDSFQLAQGERLVLKGVMLGDDQTYAIVSSLKTLPLVRNVSIESISSNTRQSNPEFQFDIRCEIHTGVENDPAAPAGRLVAAPTGL